MPIPHAVLPVLKNYRLSIQLSTCTGFTAFFDRSFWWGLRTPNLGEGGGPRWSGMVRSKERWWVPTGSPYRLFLYPHSSAKHFTLEFWRGLQTCEPQSWEGEGVWGQRGSSICQGADHGERAEREPKQASGGGAPSGVQGQSTWWGSRLGEKPSEKLFVIFIQKVAKS